MLTPHPPNPILWGNYHFWGPSVHVDKSFTKIQARVRPPSPIPAMPEFWEFLFLAPLPNNDIIQSTNIDLNSFRFGFETFLCFWWYQYRVRKILVLIKVSVSVSKIFGIKKSIGIGIGKNWYRKKIRTCFRSDFWFRYTLSTRMLHKQTSSQITLYKLCTSLMYQEIDLIFFWIDIIILKIYLLPSIWNVAMTALFCLEIYPYFSNFKFFKNINGSPVKCQRTLMSEKVFNYLNS